MPISPLNLPTPNHVVTTTFGSTSSIGGIWWSNTTPNSTTYPTANLAIYMPFRLPTPTLIAQLFCSNGTAVSGNVDVGIYDEAGTRLVSSGSTAQAGTSTNQAFNITDMTIGPGLFYLAVAMDNTTGTLFATTASALNLKFMGFAQEASAFPLPATATFATNAGTFMPIIGFTSRSVL
jgi:hypothetical protein